MRSRLLKYWDQVRSSFWFLPSLLALGATALAFAAITSDEIISDEWLSSQGWAYTGSSEGASAVLETIAGSMITIAGVVFSLTLVALTLASSQFGPRLLRNFMRDTANQVVLGTFIATFLYCLLVLRTIRYGDGAFVPHLSITLAVLFAVASIAVLIYFIHHVSMLIQADEIIARVGEELARAIDKLFPEHIGAPASSPSERPPAPDRHARSVCAPYDGYLQLVDADELMELAATIDAVVHVERRPGDYIVQGVALARVDPSNRITDDVMHRLTAAFVIGDQRTTVQDIRFIFHQLVEIAVRALSPGINDPFTAMTCIDRLTSALCRLAKREPPSAYRYDDDGRLRVVAPPISITELLAISFDPIRQYGRSSALVTQHLLDGIATIADAAAPGDSRAALRRLADDIARAARAALLDGADRAAVEQCYAAAVARLET